MQKACPIWSEWLTNWVFGASLEGSPTNESQRCRILKYVLWDKRRWRRRGLSVASRRPPQSPDVHVRSWHFATESYVRFSNRPFWVKRLRLTTAAVSMSLAGSRFSSDSAPGPFHHGIRGRGGTICYSALPSD